MPASNGTAGRAVADDSTIAVFQAEWATYRKMVENNFLFHREAYAQLGEVLKQDFQEPFHFLDIACGDASASASALQGTAVAAYTGIDFSALALELARTHLARLRCPVTLVEGDFLRAVDEIDGAVDIVWIGLSLHHLQRREKAAFMRKVRGLLKPGGRLLMFENTSPDGEDRSSWMDRWDQQRAYWHAYSADEWTRMTEHVHAADFPETLSSWRALGREAGFGSCEDLYTTPTDLFRVWSFAA